MPDMYGNPTYEDYMNLSSQNYLSPGIDLADAQAQNAQRNAQAAYYNAMAAGAPADRALAQAKFEWQKTMDTATQSGMWQGQWSNPQEQWFTGQFGQWYGPGGAPTAGTPTQQAQQQAYQQAFNLSQAYGQYYAPGTTPIAGNLTSQQQQQQFQNAQHTAG